MSKEISEKTFELNITSELLNLSKSFLWYLDKSPAFQLLPRSVCFDFLNQTIMFAEGLTQRQEANQDNGGYDVVIKFKNTSGMVQRLMFLQFKSGKKCKFSKRPNSIFNPSNSDITSTEHVCFKFNDDSKKMQHSTLRTIALKNETKSVMYVFPRITEITDFESKIGNLINYTSFVPIEDLDKQAEKENVKIKDGGIHKYRTSFDGSSSEINLLLLTYNFDSSIVAKILSELICIQIERLINSLAITDMSLFQDITLVLREGIVLFANNYLERNNIKNTTFYNDLITPLDNYLNEVKNLAPKTPIAPSNYTLIIPEEGLKIKFDNQTALSKVSYQVF